MQTRYAALSIQTQCRRQFNTKETPNLAQTIHQALDAFNTNSVLELLFHFNSVNICSRVSSSDLRKSLAFATTFWVSVLCGWLKISDMLDEPPPFHARIYRTCESFILVDGHRDVGLQKRKKLTFLVLDGTSERLPTVATAIRLSFSCFGVISATAKAESLEGWRERK